VKEYLEGISSQATDQSLFSGEPRRKIQESWRSMENLVVDSKRILGRTIKFQKTLNLWMFFLGLEAVKGHDDV